MTASDSTAKTTTDELTALKHLAACHSIQFAAAASRLTEPETAELALHHGHPNRGLLAAAAHELQERLVREAAQAALSQSPTSS